MDHVEEARVKIVQAMEYLEGALASGLPAESPHSEVEDIRAAIQAIRAYTEWFSKRIK